MGGFSKVGFILATLGSSIGLGHIWRFPYITGENGGSAFVVVYLLLALFIGIPLLVAKMIIGNKTQKDIIAAFDELDVSAKKHWKLAGAMIIGGPLILTFYAVVLGWAFYYLFIVSFGLPGDIEQSKGIFNTIKNDNLIASIVSFTACMLLTGIIVSQGIKNGIEKCNLVLMPLLFFIFIGLFFYAMKMESFGVAAEFMFRFDIEKITPSVIIMALSQVFFSLSLGVGVITTYSASAKKGENLLSSAAWIAFSGLFISLMAGMIIFTFLFNFNQSASAGEGMLFIALPLVFGKMAYGGIISFLFFIAVLFAGITSTISLFEPPVAFLEKRYNISRFRAALLVCLAVILIGIFVILSLSDSFRAIFSFWGKTLFVWIDFITAAIIMPLGVLGAIIFLGFVVPKKALYRFCRGFMSRGIFNVWYGIIKFFAPLVIVVILVSKFIETFM